MSSESSLSAAIHDEVEGLILSGAWKPGSRIPTEMELMVRYGCARMTVHKALARLAQRGLIVRRRRAGSFVAMPSAEQAVLTIADFAEEAARTGALYTHEVAALTEITATLAPFEPGERLVAVSCRHLMDGVPVAWEERLIRVAAVPGVVRTRFHAQPPGPWLMKHIPWSEAEHEISAMTADATMAARLKLRRGAALLCLHRRTWHLGRIVTDVRFAFPGDRQRFTARFSPAEPRAEDGAPPQG